MVVYANNRTKIKAETYSLSIQRLGGGVPITARRDFDYFPIFQKV